MSKFTTASKAAWQQARQDTQNAWAAYCVHRALLWEFHIYDVVAKSCRDKVNRGVTPTEKFLLLFNTLRKRLLRRTTQLPEYEQWVDRYRTEREAKLVYIHTLIQGAKV